MKRLISSCHQWCPQCSKPVVNIAFPARQCLTCQRHLWSLRFLTMKTAGYLCPNLCWAICHQAHACFSFCSSCSDGSHSIRWWSSCDQMGPTASAGGPAVIRWVPQHLLVVQLWSDGSHSICWWSSCDQMGPTASADAPAVIRWVPQHPLMVQLWSDGSHSIRWWSSCDQMGPTASADGPAVIRWVPQHPLMVQLWSDGSHSIRWWSDGSHSIRWCSSCDQMGPTASAGAPAVIRWVPQHPLVLQLIRWVAQRLLMAQLWSDGSQRLLMLQQWSGGPHSIRWCFSWAIKTSSFCPWQQCLTLSARWYASQ